MARWQRSVVVLLTTLFVLSALLLAAFGHELARASQVESTSVAEKLQPASRPAIPAGDLPRQDSDSRSIVVKLAPGTQLVSDSSLTISGLGTAAQGSAAQTLNLSSLGLQRQLAIASLNVEVLGTTDQSKLDEDLQALRSKPGVLWAQETEPRHALLTPDDPYYPEQWALPEIGLPAAWDLTTGSSKIIVAVLDTGLDSQLPDFAGRIVSPYSVLTNSSAPSDWADDLGHGTGTAGVAVAAGNNGTGMVGAAWGVSIMPVKVSEDGATDDVTMAAGVVYAVDHGANVINVSFGGPEPSIVEQDAISYALSHGVLVVAAAGNDGQSPPFSTVEYPAAYPGVIAVGAADDKDSVAPFSSAGTELALVAPGINIATYPIPLNDNLVGYESGTSYSAPLVAGVAALMLSVNPGLSPQEVTSILETTAEDLGAPGWDSTYGYGLVQANAAVAAAEAQPTTTPSATTTTTGSTTTTTGSTSTSTTSTSTTGTSTTSTTSPASTTTTTVVAARFPDVTPSVPYASQILDLASHGIVSGEGDGLFRPTDPVLRMQFAKMIVLTMGYPVSLSDIWPFRDVPDPAGQLYPFHYVAVGAARGLIQGTGPKTFSPFSNITRAQMITMVARAAALPDPPASYVPPFPDFSPVHYPDARKAAYAGLLSGLAGIGPSYDFLADATRGEASALLDDLLKMRSP